jgi:hypothetical protein
MPGPPMGMGGAELVDPTEEILMDMFDTTDLPMRKMEGGGTVRTWDIPPECERLMYTIATNGRPLKAKVELVRLVFCVLRTLFVLDCRCACLPS